jgi:hypothetical protein
VTLAMSLAQCHVMVYFTDRLNERLKSKFKFYRDKTKEFFLQELNLNSPILQKQKESFILKKKKVLFVLKTLIFLTKYWDPDHIMRQ